MGDCPKCDRKIVCGCKSCYNRRKFPLFRKWKWVFKGEGMQCPYCRTKFTPDQVLDYEYKQRNNYQ